VRAILSICLSVVTFSLLFATPQTGQSYTSLAPTQVTLQTFIEDFTSDTDPTMGGFASSRFVHTNSGGFIFAEGPEFFPVAPFPSPPHAMFRFTGSDEVTFVLTPGETVSRAKVWVNSRFGEAHVTIVGSSSSKSVMFSQGVLAWQSVEVRSTDLGDSGSPLGDISQITLVGFEALFDNVEIDVEGTPGPSPAFDLCLQDDSNGNLLKINSATGEYEFVNCRGGLTVAGTGVVIIRGSTVALQHNAADRRVAALVDNGVLRGTASLQLTALGITLTITDRNTSNNGCTC